MGPSVRYGSCLSFAPRITHQVLDPQPSLLPFSVLTVESFVRSGSVLASNSLFPLCPVHSECSLPFVCVPGSLLCDFPAVLLFSTSCFSFQLNLIHSEISNLAGFEVEAIINPTNADIDLKDDLGNWGWVWRHQLSGEKLWNPEFRLPSSRTPDGQARLPNPT